jgi:hypothetical protein
VSEFVETLLLMAGLIVATVLVYALYLSIGVAVRACIIEAQLDEIAYGKRLTQEQINEAECAAWPSALLLLAIYGVMWIVRRWRS